MVHTKSIWWCGMDGRDLLGERTRDDLRRALSMMGGTWAMQDDAQDRLTRFVYRVDTLDELLGECARSGADANYALHRWYNFVTSRAAEAAFCAWGARPEPNARNHDIDIWVPDPRGGEVPYDVKLTVYPRRLSGRPHDISTRRGKDVMMRWLYANQSQQGRKELTNRIYVMVDEVDPARAYAGKSDTAAISAAARAFMSWTAEHGHHPLEIEDGGAAHVPYAELVRIAPRG